MVSLSLDHYLPVLFHVAGLNKHFNMVCIQHKLQQSVGLFLTTKQIWDHLKTLYDLDSLVSSSFVWMCNSLVPNLTSVMK